MKSSTDVQGAHGLRPRKSLTGRSGRSAFDADSVAHFWSKVDRRGPNDCWLWTASLSNGYGQIRLAGRSYLAHRLSYERAHGPGSAAGLVVRHKCDVRRCCNSAHLEIGTIADNVADRVARGRSAAKLTPEQARDIATCGGRQADVAARFRITQGAVSLIRRGRIWAHVTGLVPA